MASGRRCSRRAVVVVLGSVVAAGCTAFGPYALDQTRLHYNGSSLPIVGKGAQFPRVI
jgi:hypothetical protein